MAVRRPQVPTGSRESAGGISRRSVVGAAAWGAPTIVAATAVPAFAASGPTITATYAADSFRTTRSGLSTATPSAGSVLVVRIDVAVDQAGVDDLTCLVTSTGGPIRFAARHAATNRGATRWASNNVDLTNSWAVVPGLGALAESFTLMRPARTTRVRLKAVLNSVQPGDYPLTFLFSSTQAGNVAAVTVTPGPAPSYVSGGASAG